MPSHKSKKLSQGVVHLLPLILLVLLGIAALVGARYLTGRVGLKTKAFLNQTGITFTGPNVVAGKATARTVQLKIVYDPITGGPSIVIETPAPTLEPGGLAPTPQSAPGTTITYTLGDGYTVIGVPVQTTATPAQLLASTNGKCTEVLGFDVTARQAQAYFTDPARAQFNNLTQITGGRGYFIKCSGTGATVSLSGPAVTAMPSVVVGSVQYVSLPKRRTMTAEEFLQQVSTASIDCVSVDQWIGLWEPHTKGRSANNFQMVDTEGYNVRCITGPTPAPTPSPTPQGAVVQPVIYRSNFTITQGQNNVSYLAYNHGEKRYEETTWDGTKWTVGGVDRNFRIDGTSFAPSWNAHAVVRWTAPQIGRITIAGSFQRCCAEPGDANRSPYTVYTVRKNTSEKLWEQNSNDTTRYPYSLSTSVAVGDTLEFWADANNDSGWDASDLDFTIIYTQQVQGLTAYAQESNHPTEVRVGNNIASLQQAQALPFTIEDRLRGKTIDWTLTEGTGQKTVYGQFKINGQWKEIMTATIMLEEIARPTPALATPAPALRPTPVSTPRPTVTPQPSPTPCPLPTSCPNGWVTEPSSGATTACPVYTCRAQAPTATVQPSPSPQPSPISIGQPVNKQITIRVEFPGRRVDRGRGFADTITSIGLSPVDSQGASHIAGPRIGDPEFDREGIYSFSLRVTPGKLYRLDLQVPRALAVIKKDIIFDSSPTSTITVGKLVIGNATDTQAQQNQDIQKIDLADFQVLASSFGKQEGQGDYKKEVDFTNDGVVNLFDFGILALNFGKQVRIE